MAKTCEDCNGKGKIQTVKTKRIWDAKKKRIKIEVSEVTQKCPTCKGWGTH